MNLTTSILDPLVNLHGPIAYVLIGTLAFAEAAAFVGFVLPGETAAILGGVLAFRHSVALSLMIAVVVLAAITGDSVGYEVGKQYGARILSKPAFARRAPAIDKAREQLRTKGGRVVLLGRFTAFLRAVTPGLAGIARMPYRTFFAWNAAGGVIWGTGFVSLGYLAGAGYPKLERYAGYLSYLVLAVAAATVALASSTEVCPRRSTSPPSSGPPMPSAIA